MKQRRREIRSNISISWHIAEFKKQGDMSTAQTVRLNRFYRVKQRKETIAKSVAKKYQGLILINIAVITRIEVKAT